MYLLFHIFSEGQDLSALAGWLYFRLFHEAMVKLLAQKGLEDLPPCWPTWLLAGGFSTSLCGAVHWGAHTWPFRKREKPRWQPHVLWNLFLEVVYSIFY